MTQPRNIIETLRDRRTRLAMPQEELSRRSGVSLSTVKRVLSGETRAGFASVVAIAHALGVDLSPKEVVPADRMRRRQARAKAERLVGMVQATSGLESQGVDTEDIRLMIDRTVLDLLRGPRSALWAAI